MVSPVGGHLPAGNALLVIQLFLPDFEAALPFLLNHNRVLCDILGQFMPYIPGKDSYTGGRGGGVTEPFTSRSQVKSQSLYSVLQSHTKALMSWHLIHKSCHESNI